MTSQLLNGARAILFDLGNTLGLPDWPRISAVAERVTPLRFGHDDLRDRMIRIWGEADRDREFLRQVADKAVPKGWEFRRLYAELGLEGAQLDRLMEALLAEHDRRHLLGLPNPEAATTLGRLRRRGLRRAERMMRAATASRSNHDGRSDSKEHPRPPLFRRSDQRPKVLTGAGHKNVGGIFTTCIQLNSMAHGGLAPPRQRA